MNTKKIFNALMAFFTFVFFVAITKLAYGDCIDGSFYDPDRKGEGFNIEKLEDGRLLAYFYTYRFNEEEFLVLIGSETEQGTYLADVYDTKMASSDPFAVDELKAGEAKISFNGNDEFDFTIDLQLDIEQSDENVIPWCLGSSCSWEGKVSRLTSACQ